MKPLTWDQRYTPADKELIERKARRIFGKRHQEQDREDLMHELGVHLIQAISKFDPARGTRDGFVGKMLDNEILHFIEKRHAKKRGVGRVKSLDAVEGMDVPGDEFSTIEKQVDVRQKVSEMPPELSQVALMLSQWHTVAEIQGLLRLSRHQVRGRIKHIRQYFEESDEALPTRKRFG